MQLFQSLEDFEDAISPLEEMAAYESLWVEQGATFKTIADKFRASPGALPSDLVPLAARDAFLQELKKHLTCDYIRQLGIRIHGASDYPAKLRDADHPIEAFYYQGWWDLTQFPAVAVVGARKPSEEGVARTRKLTRALVKHGYTIVSGLAQGIDTAAHTTAIAEGGRTIAVLGTPLNKVYPKENKGLMDVIRNYHLVISQVPFLRYAMQNFRTNRLFFPARNVTMSALTEATVIVEASDTSGTLHQARAAVNQGRKLFILDSCFRNPSISWPRAFQEKGAIRVTTMSDITDNLDCVRETRSD